MSSIQIEWDPDKDILNQKKHQISFIEAKSVFFDPNAKLIHDPIHSLIEDRFIILGISRQLRLLLVCHCYRKGDRIIRIISARKATKNESTQYGKESGYEEGI